MKHNCTPGFLLHLLVIITCCTILIGPTREAYATGPEEQPQPAVDSSLKQQADELQKDAIALAQKDDLKGALDKYKQALELYRRAGDHKGEARALTEIGIAYRELHDLTKALDYLQQAITLWRSIADSAEEARTLVNIGLIYVELNNKQKVLDYYTQALPLIRETGNHKGEALILAGLGHLYRDLGDFQKALDYSQQALPLLRSENSPVEEAVILQHIGIIYWESQADAKKALDYHTQSLALWRDLKKRTKEAATLRLIGGASEQLGDYRAALQCYTDALSIYRDLKDEAEEAKTLNLIGVFYASLGDNGKALDYYQRALSIRQATKDLAGQAEELSHIGQIYSSLDQGSKAITSYNQSISLWQTLNNYTEAADNLYLIGYTYYSSLEEPEKAIDPLKQSLELMQKQTYEGSWGNDAAIILAEVYIELGDETQARKYLDLAIQLGKKLEYPKYKAILASRSGLAYTRLGDYKVAVEYFNRALDLYKGMQDRDGEASTLARIGSTYARQSMYQQALNYYEQSIQLQEEIRARAKLEELKTLLSGRHGTSDAYAGMIDVLMRLKQASLAFNYSERARARTFLDQLGNTRLDIHKGAGTQLIDQEQALKLELVNLDKKLREEYSKPGSQSNQGVIDSLQGRLISKQKDYEDLLTQIKLNNPEYASQVSVASLTLPEVQKSLDKDVTLISYFVTGNRTLAFVITRDIFEAVELPINEKDLETAITEFRGFPSLEDVPLPTLKHLYEGLIAPLKPYLKTPMVGIIPHRTLNYLPFAALTDGQRYFGDDYTLFYLPSASVLQFIQQKRKPDSGNAFVLAQSRPKDFPELRYADQEARDVAKLYNAEPLIGKAATKSAFSRLAGNYSIVHVAAHGKLNATNPLFSRLMLAPDANADGSLEVREVYGLDLQKTQLVVLSACQTQLGKQSRGDDIIGLNRAFIYAGTPTIVASLWSVDDEATNILMTAFHTHFKQGMGKAAALQAAQAETRANHPHPYYWAAFVLTGDPGKTTQ